MEAGLFVFTIVGNQPSEEMNDNVLRALVTRMLNLRDILPRALSALRPASSLLR
jgi:hypothetical protein